MLFYVFLLQIHLFLILFPMCFAEYVDFPLVFPRCLPRMLVFLMLFNICCWVCWFPYYILNFVCKSIDFPKFFNVFAHLIDAERLQKANGTHPWHGASCSPSSHIADKQLVYHLVTNAAFHVCRTRIGRPNNYNQHHKFDQLPDPGCAMLQPACRVHDAACWLLGSGPWSLHLGCSSFVSGHRYI